MMVNFSWVSKKMFSGLLVSCLALGSCYAQDDSISCDTVKKVCFAAVGVAGLVGFAIGLKNSDKTWGFPVVFAGAVATWISSVCLFCGPAGEEKPCDPDCPCHNDPTYHHSLFCDCDECADPLDDRFWNFDS